MKIAPLTMNSVNFGNSQPDANVSHEGIKKKTQKKYKDPLQNYPMRMLGYTNDVGVAINELFPTFATLCWIPALMYFGADVYDKYKNKGNTYDPNAKRAFSQAVFQANASIIMPMLFGHIGASAFSQVDKYHGLKLSTNAKEQTLRYIKRYAASEKIFDPNQDKDAILKDFSTSFDNFYQNSSKTYKNKNIFFKIYDKLLGNCRKGAVANSNETRLKDFANNKFKNIIDNAKDLDALNAKFDKDIFKLKAWKSAGSFTALLLTMKFIDSFTENILIKKILEPQMKKIDFHKFHDMTSFTEKDENPSAAKSVSA